MALASRRGATLVEAMATVAVTAILASMAAPLMRGMTDFWVQNRARVSIQRDIRTSLDTILRFTRQARAGTAVVDAAAGQPPASRLTFIEEDGRRVSFYQRGAGLWMSLDGVVSLLSSRIAYVAFSYPRTDDVMLIDVGLATQAPTARGGRATIELSVQTVRIMNP